MGIKGSKERGLSREQRAVRRSVALEAATKADEHVRQFGGATLNILKEDFVRWCTVFNIPINDGALEPFGAIFVNPYQLVVDNSMSRPNVMRARIREIAETYNARVK